VPKLVVFRGDAVESEVPLTGQTLRIGRHATNDIVLDDSANGISRFHAELQCAAGKYFIVDQKSRNGVWVNGRRITGKTPLSMGVPITIGGFELTLEDDLSSGEIDVQPAANYAPTVAVKSGAAVGKHERVGTTNTAQPRSSIDRRQVIVWASTVAILVFVSGVTFAVVRYITGRSPQTVVTNEPSTPLAPAKFDIPLPVDQKPDDGLKEQISGARDQLEAGDLDGATQAVAAVLEQDPDSAEANELKGRIEDARQRARPAIQKPLPKPADEQPQFVETPGIPRRAGESVAEYEARVRRVQNALANGKASLDRGDFAAALTSFQIVQREQPGYLLIESLITETRQRQQNAVANDLRDGGANEKAGNLRAARLFYLHALQADPSSVEARTKAADMKEQTSKQAQPLLTTASAAAKLGSKDLAKETYQKVVDLMIDGDPEMDKAKAGLEGLK
jgi:tetratricopeptide (TPR) repeat protein